jgi:hypothetical protein
MEILKVKGKLAALDDVPVELIPLSQSRELGAWKASKRAEVEPVDTKGN